MTAPEPMLTAEQLGAGFTLAVVAFLLACLIVAAQNGLVAAYDRLDQRRRRHAAADAAVFGEPTREQVEADLEADAEWAALLAAVDADPSTFRAAYARATTHP